MRKHLKLILIGAVVVFGAGCGESSGGGSAGAGGSGGAGGTAGVGGGGVSDVACAPEPHEATDCEDLAPTGAAVDCSAGGGTDICADNGGSGTVSISSEEIAADTCLSADCDYLLTRETYVTNDSTLSIEPGVTVRGADNSALIITTSGKIAAAGSESAPIIFTSSRDERQAGDWGGVVLLGEAVLSWGNEACGGDTGTVCRANIEGLPPAENRGLFGGEDDTHDCGYLSYARIEYAGFVFGENNELNALTVGGCGSDTNLSHIQVHRGLDDGVEFFGGTASIDHVIVTGTGDDCLDWDQGYRGAIRCFIGHHFNASSNDPRGIEGDNSRNNNNVSPRSTPYVQYGTLIGDATAPVSVTDQGIVVRRGSCGAIHDVVVYGFGSAGYDYRDGAWAAPMSWPTNTTVEGSCFMGNDPNYPEDLDCGSDGEQDCNDDDGAGMLFPESEALADAARGNAETDPELGDVSGAVDDSGVPDYSVGSDDCVGGFGPGGTDWTAGWTAYPVD